MPCGFYRSQEMQTDNELLRGSGLSEVTSSGSRQCGGKVEIEEDRESRLGSGDYVRIMVGTQKSLSHYDRFLKLIIFLLSH